MDNGQAVVHYYHANADAFGGRLEKPFEQVLPILAPSSLPTVGGYGSARHENFRVGELISIDRAYTQVIGVRNEGQNGAIGNFSTLATAVIEGVNINHTFFADRIAVQIATDHPADLISNEVGYYPRVSLVGTHFSGLRVGTAKIEPTLNLNLSGDVDPTEYPSQSWLHNSQLRKYARDQSQALADGAAKYASKPGFYSRLLSQHSNGGPNSDAKIQQRGNIIVSVVDTIKVDGVLQGITVGHTIEIPEFGRISLGELVVDHDSFDLTMLRLDLGCATQGQAAGPHGSANGGNSRGT